MMTTNEIIKNKKILYVINREVAKISALSSCKTGKYECHTGTDMLPSDQGGIITQAKFTYSLLVKVFEK